MGNGLSIWSDPGWSSLSAAARASHSWPYLLSVRTHVGPDPILHWPRQGSGLTLQGIATLPDSYAACN